MEQVIKMLSGKGRDATRGTMLAVLIWLAWKVDGIEKVQTTLARDFAVFKAVTLRGRYDKPEASLHLYPQVAFNYSGRSTNQNQTP